MMGLTESARHLPPPGTEEELRPLSPRSRRVPPCFQSDTRHAISTAGFATGCVLVASSLALAKQRGLARTRRTAYAETR